MDAHPDLVAGEGSERGTRVRVRRRRPPLVPGDHGAVAVEAEARLENRPAAAEPVDADPRRYRGAGGLPCDPGHSHRSRDVAEALALLDGAGPGLLHLTGGEAVGRSPGSGGCWDAGDGDGCADC